ncbi:PREDICTED: uncharacterized protein LOC108767651 isoform X2 [Trachymyrmex cornetzi]|uniref:uncharacterized protein LOC108767651 isoform X2 n=1 Tax=Trachymyrmex cornetzi TaxID=471704 RepID=UPI00084F2F5F|nr:PREDICTED: uncharacterized protein LOC108767651 isoform X2 [Trachymyrmex cornetzi]
MSEIFYSNILHALKETMMDKLVCKFTWRGSPTTEKLYNNCKHFIPSSKITFFAGPNTKAEFKKEKYFDVPNKGIDKKKIRELKSSDTDTEHRGEIDEEQDYEKITQRINELKWS